MTWPVNFSYCHITAKYFGINGMAMNGSVTFTPSPKFIIDLNVNEIFIPTPLVASLVNGIIAIDIPASDDPDISPNGWTYQVSESLSQADTRFNNAYNIYAPADQAVDLSQVTPVVNNVGQAIIRGPMGPSGSGAADPTILKSVIETAGVYGPRPAWVYPVVFIGPDTPPSGGTTAGGGGSVSNLDLYLRTLT